MTSATDSQSGEDEAQHGWCPSLGPLDRSVDENLMKCAEFFHDILLHNETLAHSIFYALTFLIVGIWGISSEFLTSLLAKSVSLLFSAILAFEGLLLTYRFQSANDEYHAILNRIRKKLRLQELTYEKGKRIFPKEWGVRCDLKTIYDLCLISRTGIKATGRWSWWAVYKWIHLTMLLVGVFMLVCQFFN